MTNFQTNPQLDWPEEYLNWVEEYFVVELEIKPTEELRQFLAGSWTASILPSEGIEELCRYLGRRQKEESPRQAFQ